MEKSLLNSAPHAFQALHTVLGFDFCAPYGIAHIDGSYTVNRIIKTAEAGGYKYGDVIAVLTRGKSRWKYSSSFSLATVAAGRVDIDYKTPWGSDIDWFINKKSFESVRKAAYADTWVIWQARELLKKPVKKEPDLTARFEVDRVNYTWCNNRKCISSLTLKRTDASREKVEHGYMLGVYHLDRVTVSSPTDPAECIDKSGYLIYERRIDLIRRAGKLRAERAKAAADAEDNTGRIETLTALLARRRAELVQALAAADTIDRLEDVGKAIAGWTNVGLLSCARDVERFRDRVERKAFNSVAARDQMYNDILKNLKKEG